MSLGLDTIASLGAKGNDKAAILAALFANMRNSVLGTYEFDPDGDTTRSDCGVHRVVNGLPTFSYEIFQVQEPGSSKHRRQLRFLGAG
jgi:hypothetical protein